MGVSARGWCRVDLAGGTLDIWPLGVLHRGSCTVNVAIDLPVEVVVAADDHFSVSQGDSVVRAASAGELASNAATDLVGEILLELAAPPMAVAIRSASPRGGGLGASSALAVALIAAVEKATGREPSSPQRASALARDLEARLMGLPTGCQDHYPALLGGALAVTYGPGGESVRRLDVDLEALGRCLAVGYTGQSHFSAGSNWQVVRRRLDGEAESVELFEGISRVASELSASLEAGDLEAVGRRMAEEWSYRRRLAPGVSTPQIETLLATAIAEGAWGGKATGAGGGGCVAVLAPADRRFAVEAALEGAGAQVLAVRPAAEGLRVV